MFKIPKQECAAEASDLAVSRVHAGQGIGDRVCVEFVEFEKQKLPYFSIARE